MSLILPSYQSGFAPRDYEPAYPSLWQGCVGAWAPLLGPTGLVLRDSVGKNDGVLTNGPTWDLYNGKYAINFDGNDDVITVDNPSKRLLLDKAVGKPWSVSAWIKIAQGPALICGTWPINTHSGWTVGVRNTHQVQFGTLVVNGTGGNYARGSSLVNTNLWTHVAAVFFGQSTYPIGRVFINGVEDTITNIAGGQVGDLTSPTFAIGNLPPPYGFGNPTNGQLDDILVYERMLSPNEIKLLSARRGIAYEPKRTRKWYFRGVSPKKKLLEAKITSTVPGSYQTGYAPRDGEPVYPELWKGCVGAWSAGLGPSNVLRDNSHRKNNGDIIGAQYILPGCTEPYSQTPARYALDFDGLDDYVNIGKQLITEFPFTITCFVRSDGGQNTYACPISQGHSGNQGFAFQYGFPASNDLQFIVGNGSGWTGTTFDYNPASITRQWVALAVTVTPSNVTTYRDAIQRGTTNVNTSLGAFNFTIGRDTANTDSNNRTWNGQVDDVRLYNRILTYNEIRTIATRRNIAYEYKRPRTLFRAYDPIKQVGVGKITSIIPGGYHTGVGGVNNEPAYPELTKGLVGGWCPSLGVTGGVLRDNSGLGNHGTLTNMNTGTDWVVSGGKYALDFDGSNDFVEMSLATSAVSNFTLTTWVKLASLNQNSVMFIQNGWDNRISDGTGYGIGIGNGSGGSGGKLVGVASKIAWMDSGFTFSSTDKWYFVAMKRDTTTTRFYVDGILQSGTSTATPLAPQLKTSLAAQFNNISSYNGFLAGALDDIRIYNRALSDSEIRLLASRRGIGYDYKSHRSYSKTQSSGLRRRILTGLP